MNVKIDELEWFIGNTLPVPDKFIIEFDDVEIVCETLFGEWDENKPIFSYSCEYSNGNREVVRIPLEKIIDKYIKWKEWNSSYNLDDIVETCILERLKLID